jgi:hypothetical protein
MFSRNANSSLGNYSHYDRASHPTRQDSSEIIPVRQKLKTFSLTVREKCRLKALRSRLRKRRTRGNEMEREKQTDRQTDRDRQTETDRQRQTDRQTETDRQRQTDREREMK